jgi:pre-rRNA-processing protein IPI3
VDLFQPKAAVNSLHDTDQQATPIQVTSEPLSGAPSNLAQVHCLGVSYDGTTLLSGHASGKIVQWETGPRKFYAELSDLNAPVTNLLMLSPFAGQGQYPIKAVGVSKPKLGEGNHTFVGQFTETLGAGRVGAAATIGFADDVLEQAILDFSAPAATAASGKSDEKLRKENEELWAIVNEQNAIQKQTWSKYRKVATGKVEG